MAVHQDEFEAANAKGTARLAQTPTALSARYDRHLGRVVVALSSGLEIAFKPHDAPGLEEAKQDDLAEIEISPSGLGLHFPLLDADLYLLALLDGFLGSQRGLAPEMGKSRKQTDRNLVELLRMPESDAFDVDFEPIRIRADDLRS